MEITTKLYTRTNDTGTHYARIIVPKALRAFVAKPAVWRSLSTKDVAEAVIFGTVVAVGTQMVFQEVSDAYAESAVVVVDAEIVTTKIDIEAELKKVNQDELMIVTKSLKKSLGITIGEDDDASSGGNTGGAKSDKSAVVKKKSKTGTAGEKSGEAKLEAVEPLLVDQAEPEPLNDEEVENYIERRPHGVYRFRFWVPRPLQALFGQREVRGTLGTADRSEAIEKARPLLLDVRSRMQRFQITVTETHLTRVSPCSGLL
jgi:hypothetical protein